LGSSEPLITVAPQWKLQIPNPKQTTNYNYQNQNVWNLKIGFWNFQCEASALLLLLTGFTVFCRRRQRINVAFSREKTSFNFSPFANALQQKFQLPNSKSQTNHKLQLSKPKCLEFEFLCFGISSAKRWLVLSLWHFP